MRLLRFLPSGVYGGPHNEVAELDESFRRRGLSQVAVIPDEPGTAASRLRQRGVQVKILDTWRPRRTRSLHFWLAAPLCMARDVRTIAALVRDEGVHLVIGSGGALQ